MAEENDFIAVNDPLGSGLDDGIVPPPTVDESAFDYSGFEKIDFSPQYFADIMKITNGEFAQGVNSEGNQVKIPVNQIFAIQAAREANSRFGTGSYQELKNGTAKFKPGLKFTDEMILNYLTTMEEKGFFSSSGRQLVKNVPSTAAFGASFSLGKKVQNLLPNLPPIKTGHPLIDRVYGPAQAAYHTGKFSLPFLTGVGGSVLTSIYADEPFAEFVLGEKTVPTPDSYSTMRAGEGGANIISFSPYAYTVDKASSNFVTDYLMNRFKLNEDLYTYLDKGKTLKAGKSLNFDPEYLARNPLKKQIQTGIAGARGPRRIKEPQVLDGKPYFGPLNASQLAEVGVFQALQGTLPPAHLRRLAAIEQALKNAGEGARSNKKLTLFYESIAAGGASLFLKGAAEGDPMGEYELVAEILGAVGTPFAAQTFLTARSGIWNKVKGLFRNMYDQGPISGTAYTFRSAAEEARNRKGVQEILKQLDELGSIETSADLNALIKTLEKNLPTKKDAQGNVIPMTAGQVTKDPAIQAMEATLARDYASLDSAMRAARQQEIDNLQNLLDKLAFGEGSAFAREATRTAAEIREIIFERALHNNLRSAEDQLLSAHSKIKESNQRLTNPDGSPMSAEDLARLEQEDQMDLSSRLFNLISNQMQTARNMQNKLYKEVGNLKIDQFFLDDGTVTNVPKFIALLKEKKLIPQSKIKAQLSDLFDYAQRTSDDLNLGFNFSTEGSAASEFFKAFNRMEDANAKDSVIQFLQTVGPKLDKQLMPEKISEELIQSVLGRRDLLTGTDDRAANVLNLYAKALQEKQGLTDDTGEVLTSLSLDSLRQIRSQALASARNGTLDLETRRLAGQFAEAVQDDITNFGKFGDSSGVSNKQIKNLLTANAYSKSFADVFYRSFVGDAIAQTKEGRFKIAPETIAQTFLGNRFDPNYLKIKDIQAVGDFLTANKIEGAEGSISSVNGVLNRLLRQARYKAYDPETKTYNELALKDWLNQNQRLEPLFPDLFEDLSNFENAQSIFDAVVKRNAKERTNVNKQISFAALLTDKAGNPRSNPTEAIADAMRAGKDQGESLTRLIRVLPNKNETKTVEVFKIKNPETGFESTYFTADEAIAAQKALPEGTKVRTVKLNVDREQALEGFRASMFEYLLYGSYSGKGVKAANINAEKLYNDLFEKKMIVGLPARGRGGDRKTSTTLSDFLIKKGVFTDKMMANTKKTLNELRSIKQGSQGFDLIADFEEAKPLLDFALAISGSAIGTKTQKIISGGESGPGALIAAGKGAEAMRNIFLRMPQHQRMLFTADLLQNPQLLASMLRKYGTGENSKGVAGAIFDYMKREGYVTMPRRVTATSGEEDAVRIEGFNPNIIPENELPADDQESQVVPSLPPSNQRSDLMPQTVLPTNRTEVQPNRVTAPAPIVPPSNNASQPATRSRYAALFPNDPISGMIQPQQQGIGSLFG